MNYNKLYKAEKLSVRPSVCPSVCHTVNLPGTADIDLLPNILNPFSSYFKFVTASKCGDQIAFCSWLKSKTWATFHWKLQPYGSMGRSTDLHSGGHRFKSSRWTDFLFENQYFFHTRFINSALIKLLLGIPRTHRNGTWTKLNARHLGTWMCWILVDSCFCSFITVHWRHWCREKTVNSCCTILSKLHRQT